MTFSTLVEQLHLLPDAVKGRQFERLVAWYLRNAPEYRSLVDRVYPWSEWPERWGADAGIDLVALTYNGDLWAVQAKAYARSYSIKKADVDSFLSESNRRQFSFRLLIATTDHLGERAARTIHEQEKPVGLKLFSQLRHEDVAWPESLARLEPQAPARLSPREHQVEAVTAVVNGFPAADRGQLLMACGTGKTLTGLWVDEAIESRRTLVVVPSLSLLGQTLRAWTAQAAKPFEYLAVCSDETVAANDSFTSWTADLGVPVTTDAETVRTFLSKPAARHVVFSTYHSTPAIADAQDAGAPPFDLAIADEAHRAAGRVDSSFGAILDSDRIRARKRLFMTATPRLVAEHVRAAARERDVDVTSMDDAERFGPVLHRLSFREAIERGLLTDYRVVVVGVDDPRIGRAVECREMLTIGDGVVDAETLARQVGVLRAVERFGLRRILTFHSRKATARSFARRLLNVLEWVPSSLRPPGTLWAHHITGDMTAGERELLLDQLRSLDSADWGVLTNVRCVAEGVDVPTLDAVVFVDARRSHIDVVQAVGRAIRRSPDKKLGIVVIPVFIAPGADDHEVLESSDFQKVWAVVRALRSHDDVLAEQLDVARYELGRRSGPVERPSKIILDLPRTVSPEFARAFTARLVERTAPSWEFWFGLITRYVEVNGTAATPHDTVLDGFRLGKWCGQQRKLYRVGKLSADRASRLAALEGWAWDVFDETWERYYSLLTKFAEREGTATVPRDHVEDGEQLGRWARRQRQKYSGIVAGTLTKEQIRRLVALRGWTWDRQEDKWEQGYRALMAFHKREGHIEVPTRAHVENGVNLSAWINRQRTHHSIGRIQRQGDREERLERIPGWKWSSPVTDRWDLAYAALLKFVEREGHANVSQRHTRDGIRLGAWVAMQRSNYAVGKLSADRVERLTAVKGWRWRLRTGAPKQDQAVEALERAGRPMGPTALYEHMLTAGIDDPPCSPDTLRACLILAERDGRIKKVRRGLYAPLSWQPSHGAERAEAIPTWRRRQRTGAVTQERAVQALERAGWPMGPSALYEYMLAEGIEDPSSRLDTLRATLLVAERAGRIKKVRRGLYAPLSWPPSEVAPDDGTESQPKADTTLTLF